MTTGSIMVRSGLQISGGKLPGREVEEWRQARICFDILAVGGQCILSGDTQAASGV